MLNLPGLYIHFPWCIKKCPYCDFNSHPKKGELPQEVYFSAVEQDLTEQLKDYQVGDFGSVFFGGGTPSLMSPKYVERILKLANITDQTEVTLELNPGTLEFNSLEDFFAAGVNRLSIGAQSFQNQHLKTLGRIHSEKETIVAFETARKAGFTNINIDLMWGLPKQSVQQSLADLNHAISLDPEHISWYQLTIEPKTEFYVKKPVLPSENIQTRIEQSGLKILAENNYSRYEISAFCKLERECRHNLNYWYFGDYIGIGAGAHGKVTGPNQVLRIQKPNQPRIYQEDSLNSGSKTLKKNDLILEFLMNTLRLVNGVDWCVFEQRTGLNFSDIEENWKRLVDINLLQTTSCCATQFGYRHLDYILQDFTSL